MNSSKQSRILSLGILTSLGVLVQAHFLLAVDPPGVLNHQGRIAVAGVNYDGTGYFKFALVDETGATTFWSNDGSSTGGGEPAASVAVTVTQGHYALGLGDTDLANMTTVPASVFTDHDDVALRIWFSTDNATFEQLSPDRSIASAGYALSAGTAQTAAQAQTVAAGAVTSEMLADGAVSAEKIAHGLVHKRGEVDTFYQNWVAVEGNYACVVDYERDRLRVFDVSNPDIIVKRDSVGTVLTESSIVVMQGSYAYVINDEVASLQIVDISDPDRLVLKDSDSTGLEKPRSVAVQGNYAYVVDAGTDRLQIFDISNSDMIMAKDFDSTGLASPRSVAVQGNYAYVVDAETDRLQIFDISNPDMIVAKDFDTTGLNKPWSVAVQGKYAYAVDYGTRRLQVYDVSDPDEIVAKGFTQQLISTPYEISVQGNYAYVTSGRLRIYDISNPNNIILLGSSPKIFTQLHVSHAVQGEYVYAADWGRDEFEVYEVPTALTMSSSPYVSHGIAFGDGSFQTTAFNAESFSKNLEDSSIDTQKLADDAVTSAKLADGSVTSGIIAENAVGSDKIDDGAVTTEKLAAGAVTDVALALNSVSTDHLVNRAVTTLKIDTGAVNTFKILNETIIADDISPDIALWDADGSDAYRMSKVGVGRKPASNAFEVEGDASKTTAGSWAANSDGRIKRDIRELDGSEALARMRAVRPVSFAYTPEYLAAHPVIDDRIYLNVVAQEFAEVFPGWVKSSGETLPGKSADDAQNEILQVDAWPLTIYSAAAIKELDARNAGLERENAALRERLERLEQVIGTLAPGALEQVGSEL